jgi:hypothetical protein
MMQRIFALLALLATASAFAPASTSAAFGIAKSSTTLSMAMKAPEMSKGVMAAVAGVMPAILSSTAAVATEGTNEWFGVDDPRLLGVLFLGHWFILTLWLQQYKNYDEEEDFFGEIDYTGSKK